MARTLELLDDAYGAILTAANVRKLNPDVIPERFEELLVGIDEYSQSWFRNELARSQPEEVKRTFFGLLPEIVPSDKALRYLKAKLLYLPGASPIRTRCMRSRSWQKRAR